MAINTISKKLGKLTIKYSPDYQISEFQAYGLYCSLLLACEYLDKTIKLLTPICDGSEIEPSGLVFKTLKYHFFNTCDVQKNTYEYRKRDVIQITRGLRQILSGLSVDVTIKDSYATAVGNAIKTFDNENAERNLLADMGIGQAWSIDEYTENLNLVRRQADAEAEDVRGFVQPKKATTRDLRSDGRASSYKCGELTRSINLEKFGSNNPRVPTWMKPKEPKLVVQLASELLGSIHINFKRMLRTENSLSNAIVATTIIHEASHKFISTHDFAYTGDPSYERLDRRQTLNNADSYAYTSVSLGRNLFLKDDGAQKMADAGFV